MSKNFIETLVGATVILVAFTFSYIAYSTTSSVNTHDSYTIVAKFDRADGVNIGTDVKIGGIPVGKVLEQKLDYSTYQAEIVMAIDNKVQLPLDTAAEIIGNGLLGEKYVSLSPGIDEEKLLDKGIIYFTQSAISLESLIGKFIFSSATKADKSEAEK